MNKYLLISSFAIIFMLASCQKSGLSGNTTAIEGSFKLQYFTSQTSSSVASTDGEKTITTTDYTTTNNQGTFSFNNSVLTATGLTYTIDTEIKSYLYDGPDLIDSLSLPFLFTLPSSNSTTQYQLIGADSIYFPQGSLTAGTGATGSFQSGAIGSRYSLSGNILTIVEHYSKDSTFMDAGETIQVQNTGVANMILQKQ